MNKEQIESLKSNEIDDELFRELDCSWERKDLINHIIENMDAENKMVWIKQWFEIEDD